MSQSVDWRRDILKAIEDFFFNRLCFIIYLHGAFLQHYMMG